MKAIITEVNNSGANVSVIVQFFENNGDFVEFKNITGISLATAATAQDKWALIEAAIQAYATSQTYTMSGGMVLDTPVVSDLLNAPQAAITNCPADAVTNYNVLTTLLGSLTGAVNTANAKQNDIAATVNTILAVLRTEGLINT